MRSRLDPIAVSIGAAIALAVVAFVTIGLGWEGAAATLLVPLQLPWAVSGGVAALGLLGLALGVLAVQASRRHAAAARDDLDAFVDHAVDVLALLRERTPRAR